MYCVYVFYFKRVWLMIIFLMSIFFLFLIQEEVSKPISGVDEVTVTILVRCIFITYFYLIILP